MERRHAGPGRLRGLDRWGEHMCAPARLHAEGVTCVHDAACARPPRPSTGGSPLGRSCSSVLVMPHPAELFGGLDGARLDGPATGEGDEWLRVGAVKLFADGGVEPLIDAARRLRSDRQRSRRSTTTWRPRSSEGSTCGARDRQRRLQRAVEAFTRTEGRFRVERVCLASSDQVKASHARRVAWCSRVRRAARVADRAHEVQRRTWLPFADLLDAGCRSRPRPTFLCPCRPLADSLRG